MKNITVDSASGNMELLGDTIYYYWEGKKYRETYKLVDTRENNSKEPAQKIRFAFIPE